MVNLRPPRVVAFWSQMVHGIVVYGLMWDRLRLLNMDSSNLYIRGVRKPQNGFNQLQNDISNSNKKRDTPERVSLYKVLGSN